MTTLIPWLAEPQNARAMDFYQSAFDAVSVYQTADPDGDVVARLSIDGAEFWLSEELNQPTTNLATRMILTTADPEGLFSQALAAGATQLYPIHEEHGWRVGRLIDPFGHHWEIGAQLG